LTFDQDFKKKKSLLVYNRHICLQFSAISRIATKSQQQPQFKTLRFIANTLEVVILMTVNFCRFLVVANGLASGYSLIQGLRCIISMIRGRVLFSKPLAWAIFSGDQVHFIYIENIAYLLFFLHCDQN